MKLRIEPHSTGAGLEFLHEIEDESFPATYTDAAIEGAREALQGGVLAGYPMIDVKVAVFGGSYHESDSNEVAFKIAGSFAAKEASRKAIPVLLEPMMALEVVTSEEFMGWLIGELNSRRGRVEAIEQRDEAQVIKATVPLAETFDYDRTLRLSTQSRATYSMRFSHYEQLPKGYDPGDETSGVLAKKPRTPTLGQGATGADIPLDQ